MGNCMRHGSGTSWGGDDWGSISSRRRRNKNRVANIYEDEDARQNLLGEREPSAAHLGPPSSTKRSVVKIKMTKKELEDLTAWVNARGLTTEEVLADWIVNGGEHDQGGRIDPVSTHRSWRPALQSIPELD